MNIIDLTLKCMTGCNVRLHPPIPLRNNLRSKASVRLRSGLPKGSNRVC